MKEELGNIWRKRSNTTPVCITTNGFVKNNGECVMGRGVALQAKTMFGTQLALDIGNAIHKHGNIPVFLTEYNIITFPVKHNWWEQADIELIEQSAKHIVEIFNENDYISTIYTIRPGCANGRLSWVATVKPVLTNIFTDNSGIIIINI